MTTIDRSTHTAEFFCQQIRQIDHGAKMIKEAHEALRKAAIEMIGIKIGDIISDQQNINGIPAIRPKLTMHGQFKGWRSNERRIIVESLDAPNTSSLRTHIIIVGRGIPIKDDGEAFKDAYCYFEIDVTSAIYNLDFNEPAGYEGYLEDATRRFFERTKPALDAVAAQTAA